MLLVKAATPILFLTRKEERGKLSATPRTEGSHDCTCTLRCADGCSAQKQNGRQGKICPPSHPQHCQAVTIAAQPREGNRGIRGAVSYCRELGRHGRGTALQQCPGLLQDGQHSLLPTAERGGAGTGAEPAVLTQYSRNLICLIYSLGKKKINKWHLACPHVSLSQRRCQLNEPKPSA